MEKKKCKTCNKEKELTEFYKSNNGTTYRGRCKKCRVIIDKNYYKKNKEKVKEYRKEYYESNKLDHYIVYYLPEINYCGVTNNPTNRMNRHKTQGNNPTGWKVLATAKTIDEALEIESKYHNEMGMEGAYGWKLQSKNG